MYRIAAILFAALLFLTACSGGGSGPASGDAGGPSASAPPESPALSQSSQPAGGPSSDASAPAESTAPVRQPQSPGSGGSGPEAEPTPPEAAIPDPLDDALDGEPESAPAEPESPAAPESAPPPARSGGAGETRTFWQIREDMVKKAAAFREGNPDAVGWLYLYGTTVDSPVFQVEGDNNYYLKHNDYKQADVNGAIVSDYRNQLTGRDSQSQNIVLYAHSKDENPDGGVEASREYEHFTELKRYQKKEFCEAHPYFLFATADESMVFEVFAAFHTKTSFVYNLPNPSRDQMQGILDEAMKKSLFDFGMEVSADDRIMTLSTCCRRIVPTYPNGYRFVIMGRLVEAGKPLEYQRSVSENPTALTPANVYE